MTRLLLFVPALSLGLVALVSSAVAFDLGRPGEAGATRRNRVATWVAVAAAVLCALSLLAAIAVLVVEVLSSSGD